MIVFGKTLRIQKLEEENARLKKELAELKDDSGEAVIKRMTTLAKELKIDVHTPEWQDMAHTVFLDIAGRDVSLLKGYSQTKFMADNSDEILERLAKMMSKKSPLKHVEHKK